MVACQRYKSAAPATSFAVQDNPSARC